MSRKQSTPAELLAENKNLRAQLKKTETALRRQTAGYEKEIAALQESSLFYRIVTEHTYEWEIWENPDGSYRYVSPACKRISGYAASAFYKEPQLFSKLIVPEDQQVWAGHHREAKDAPGLKEIQFRIRRRDGGIRWIEHVCQPVVDDQGKFNGYRANNRDITERKRLEDVSKHMVNELHRSEEQYRILSNQFEAILDHLPALIFYKDQKNNFVRVNSYLAQGHGKAKKELEGKNLAEIYPKADADKYYEDDLAVMNSGFAKLNIEERWQTEDSVRWLNTSKIPFLDDSGDIIGIIGMSTDITERKQAEEALHLAEEKYRNIFENSLDGIFQSTPEGHFITVNPALARMWGYESPEDLLAGVTAIEHQVYVDPNRRSEFMRVIRQQGSINGFEYQAYRKDGSVMWVSENARAVYDEQGALRYYEGSIEDITARKQAEEALRQSEERFRDLFENSPIAIWEEDFSEVKMVVEDLKRKGVTDLRAYLAAHPEMIAKCIELVKILNVNETAVKLYEAPGKSELLGELSKTFTPASQESFRNEILVIAAGKLDFQSETTMHTFRGKPRHIAIKWTVMPGYERTYAKVLVSVIDITERIQAEEALRRYDRQLAIVVEIEHALAALLNQEQIHETLVKSVQQLFPDVATIFLSGFDSERQIIRALYSLQDGEPVDVSQLPEIPLAPDGEGIQSRVIRTRQPLIINDDLKKAARRILVKVTSANDNGRETQSAIYVPLLAQEQVLGLIQCQSYASNRFTEEDIKTLSLVANTAAVTIQNARSYAVAQDEIRERVQAEEELRASEERYRTLVNEIGDGLYVTDVHGVLTFANPALSNALGFDRPEDVIGHTFMEFVAPSMSNEIQQRYATAMQAGEAGTILEVEIVRRDGTRACLEIKPVDIIVDGKIAGSRGIASDITERKQAEEQIRKLNAELEQRIDARTAELKNSEERYRQLFNGSSDITFVFEVSPMGKAGKFIEVNEAACQQLGYTRQELLQKSPMTILELRSMKDRHQLARSMAKAGEVVFETWLRAKDGRQIPFEVNAHRFELQGQWMVLAVGRDITERLQAAEMLRESEEKYRTLFESSRDAMMTLAPPEWRFTSGNPATITMFQAKDEVEFTSKAPWEFSPEIQPDGQPSQEKARQMIETALREGSNFFEWTHKRLNGEEFPATVLLTRIERKGDVILQATVRDITGQKKAEERFRQVVEAAGNAFVMTDADERIQLVNSQAETIFGYSREQLIGQNVEALIPERLRGYHSAYRASFIADPQGRPMGAEHDLFGLRRDGVEIPIEIGLSLLVIEGETYVLASITDVSERKRSEQEYKAIITTAQDGFWIADHQGRFLDVNESYARLIGYNRDELIKMNISDVEARESAREIEEHIHKVIQSGYDRFESRHRGKDGALIDVEISATYAAQEGKFYVFVRDATERKQAEELIRAAKEEAEAASRAKSEFLARMSHELRTPLNSILGFAQLLEMSKKESLTTAQQDWVRRIIRAGHHLLVLINEVLDIARIEAGRMPVPAETVDVSQVMREAIDLMLPQFIAHQIKLEALCPPKPVFVLADKQRFKQALLNILDNAVKYNLEGGTVTISCSKLAESSLRVMVRDTGRGIPSDRLERLFKPFERLGAEESNIEGTGLGLALSKRLIELMGGKMGVESQAGEGSLFWIELPLSDSPPPLEKEKTEPLQPLPSLTALKKILYIEDNPINIQLVEQALSDQTQVKLLSAMQGGTGLQFAEQHHPDLILLDAHLPDISGMEVLHRLQKMDVTRAIPVIILSADAMPDQIKQFMQAGAHDYLTKPLDIKEFLQTIEKWLSRDLAK